MRKLVNLIPVNMSPHLKILNIVLERLKNLPNGSTGQLFGICYDDTINVVGFSLKAQKDEGSNNHNESKHYNLLQNFPAGIKICGVFNLSSGDSVVNMGNDFVLSEKKISVVINIDHVSKEVSTHSYEGGSVKKVNHGFIDERSFSKLFLYLRLKATMTLSCDYQYNYVQESFEFIQQKMEAGNGAFHIEGCNVYLLGDEPENINGIAPESTIEELHSAAVKLSDNKIENDFPILNVNIYLKDTNNDMTPQLAPVIKYVKKSYKHAVIQLAVDTLAVVPKSLKVKYLYQILVEGVCRNLRLNQINFLEQLKTINEKNVSLPQTYHFKPHLCGHFLSIVYPSKQTSDQLKKTREALHTLLALPMDKPLFRVGNAFDFSNRVSKNDSNILLNVHEGLGKSGVPDGEPFFVQGNYAYYHYMQDKFDDRGWGCAYRSLQTIFSWFRLQGYTNLPVPTHKEIQECLVKIGDKPSSFIGSKQWIGSTEVGFLLDTMLDVTCRIINVSSGEEMTMKGGELSHHFKTQGTPVMIGGGVLAHTIIGVDYNRKTGNIKFLILDPHYTGGEDLKVIQSKGWCGWKGPEFWKKDAFYNMCMPLRPKCI